jgi:hypothetical protein
MNAGGGELGAAAFMGSGLRRNDSGGLAARISRRRANPLAPDPEADHSAGYAPKQRQTVEQAHDQWRLPDRLSGL